MEIVKGSFKVQPSKVADSAPLKSRWHVLKAAVKASMARITDGIVNSSI